MVAAENEYNRVMLQAIINTKLYLPPPRRGAVARTRLIERLQEGLPGKLTLVAAPAGFGKSTIVGEWVTGCKQPSAWVSLDEADQDPICLLTYLVAALQTIDPSVGIQAMAMLQATPATTTRAILTVLLNELATITTDWIVVLDDYHLASSTESDQALQFFLEHMPPQLHLVVVTREDPQLPLARLRARGQLNELRPADLRFTLAEVAAFLTQFMALELSLDQIALLETRTEGWIAGLQLAALSMQNHPDLAGFLQVFRGDHRYIMDYLVDEVLQRQPTAIRRFLLQTAILDRLHGSLCDAVTGQNGSALQLEALERGNFFLIPLDTTRHWYRYHHLFAEALATQLRAEQPELVATLHLRASIWYEQDGSAANAIHHAFAARDYQRAANLVELAMPEMRRSRQEATLLRWLRALPENLFQLRPVLSVGLVGALLAVGELAEAEARLHLVEQWLEGMQEQSADTGQGGQDAQTHAIIVADRAGLQQLPGAIALYRTAHALALGRPGDGVAYAKQALQLVPKHDHLLYGGAAGLLGLAAWALGDLEVARMSSAQAITSLQQAEHYTDAIGCAVALADIQIVQGQLRHAMQTYQQGLQLAQRPDATLLRGAVDMYIGMSAIAYQQNNLQDAAHYVLRCQELGEQMGLPQNPYRWRVAMAHVMQAQGDIAGAQALLDAAEARYVADFFPNVWPITAQKARLLIAQGRLREATYWLDQRGLTLRDELQYLHEYEHITLARLVLARIQHEHTPIVLPALLAFLERLRQAAETGQRAGSLIEILMLQALAHHTEGTITAALIPLGRALQLAEPAGYMRIFLDEGQPMAMLLAAATQQGLAPGFLPMLQAGFAPQADEHSRVQGVFEPLSEREHTVLRLLATDMSGPQIARELVVSLNTLRTHTQHIYDKLGVTNRRAALRRAHELGLLP
jgi:LuxR family transcriptional regulator, maltose regulon positive regulatory protein